MIDHTIPFTTLFPYTTLFRSLAVGLGRDLELKIGSNPPHLVLGQVAEGEAQEIELVARRAVEEIALVAPRVGTDRKSTRLNSSHITISYAVLCLKKKKLYYVT